ncbi:DUF4962 domain-containing protein [Thetidibacter halocola]|uniref:DUF4962 domain-containing protein n=1 Tax=Thetidibacter halocola TaxID=2827239 RepID=A0A8J7WKW0_9RHOB|nr:DUF4962 domain-containing protein [Thetidibacter halocola]MBS0126883.1 DUF4962 domain-containing protein [Thetidibacter halocola]
MRGTTTPLLDEPRAGRLTIQYAPDRDTEIVENPPRFTWLPVIEDEARYVLRLSADPGFPAKGTQVFTKIPLNFFTPDTALAPGDYHWSYAVCDATGKPASSWSATRGFSIPERLPETPLASRDARFTKVTQAHPRLWLTPDRLETFRAAVKEDPDHCTWSTFYKDSVLPWMDRPVMTEPAGYPNHTRMAPVWRKTYIELQELWYAIRHLAIGGKVTGDQAMLDRAKAWLL